MTDRLQGHHFATGPELREVHDTTLRVMRPLPHERNEQLRTVAFRADGLQQIAPGQVEELEIGSGLVFGYDTTNLETSYHWPLAPTTPPRTYITQGLSLRPPTSESGEWGQYRDVPDTNSSLQTPKTPNQLIGDEAADSLLSAIFGGKLRQETSVNRWTQSEAIAMSGLMKAILAADPAQVRAMQCRQDEINS